MENPFALEEPSGYDFKQFGIKVCFTLLVSGLIVGIYSSATQLIFISHGAFGVFNLSWLPSALLFQALGPLVCIYSIPFLYRYRIFVGGILAGVWSIGVRLLFLKIPSELGVLGFMTIQFLTWAIPIECAIIAEKWLWRNRD